MFLSYLIDPRHRTVEKVSEGFDRASELLESDATEMHSLWQSMSDPDSSVDVVSSANAADEPQFRLGLVHSGRPLKLVVAGRGVLIVCGGVPVEIGQQLADTHAVESCVEYLEGHPTAAVDWLRSELGPDRRISAKRAAKGRRPRRHRASP